MGRKYRHIVLCLVVSVCIPETQTLAQASSEADAALFRHGMLAFENQRFATATLLLDSLVSRSPGWSDLTSGAASYWLGKSLRESGMDSLAARAWGDGVRAMQEGSRFDVRLADAYLGHLMEDPSRLDEAMGSALDLYVNLLYNADALLTEHERGLISRHLAQLALVVPAGVLSDVLDPSSGSDEFIARPGAGPLLVAWWRSQDPVPATRSNERLEEHLRRVAEAVTRFGAPERPAGFDIRGEIFLRYGRPQESITITFDDPVLTDIIYQPGVTVNLSDFPQNEFWVFGHIDRSAWFLFVQERGSFRVGETIDLVPTPLRSGFGTSQRGRQKAGMAIAVLQNVFRQLAPLHPDFAMRYAEVDNYAMQLPEFGVGRIANRTSGSLASPLAGVQGETQIEQPGAFIQNMMVKSRSEDDASIARREDYAPHVYTEALAEVGRLEVGYRSVRYLEPDGSTRTVIHWSPDPGGLRPGRSESRLLRSMAFQDDGRYLITLTAVQKDAQYLDRVVNKDRFIVENLPERNEAIPVQQTTLAGDTALFNVALQWDQFALQPGSSRTGPRLRVTTARLDSLPPLNSDPRTLEMSDLLPMAGLASGSPADFVPTPYPYAVLTRDLQLAVSFEVYHLDFDRNDQTSYTVSFEVKRDANRGGLLTRRSGPLQTGSSFQATGSSRKATEMILVDLQSWEGSGELEILVTVTDNVSRQSVTRDLSFELR